MMNSSIRDILAINISELSKDQLANIEQKLMQSNQKLPLLLAENLITDPQHYYFLEKLKTMRKERPDNVKIQLHAKNCSWTSFVSSILVLQ